jgi:predicted ATPase
VSLLPSQPTPFVGRERELAEIDQLLGDPACRLLALVGPGGIGKTRLAIEAAANRVDSFGDGVFFVPLQPLASADYLVPAIAEVLQFPFAGQESAREMLVGYLGDKQMLLLLDNFEHLLAGVDLLPAILNAAPGVRLLVTSREVLGLREEWIRTVDGLSYPDTDRVESVSEFASVRLFTQRARQVRADFDLDLDRACVVRICRLVQGMPLAIELAAAWLKTLPCTDVAPRDRADPRFPGDNTARRTRAASQHARCVRAILASACRGRA